MLEVQHRPNAFLCKRPERTRVAARVCVSCGYVELYANAPGALYPAFLQAEAGPNVSALEELEQTREALHDAHARLHELEEKLAFVEGLLEGRPAPIPPPLPPPGPDAPG